MGIIFSQDFVDFTSMARTSHASYPVTNIADLWRMVRCFQAADAIADDWLIKVDFGADQAVAAICLNWVNFTAMKIEGNATDSWTSPSFSETVAIERDPVVNRYKGFYNLTSFNYRYMRIKIPSGQIPVFGSVWQIGSLAVMKTVQELDVNMATYPRTSSTQFVDVNLNGRLVDRVPMGDHLAWSGTLDFGRRRREKELELWTLNAMDITRPMVFFENIGNSFSGYICIRDDWHKGTMHPALIIQGDKIGFRELV